jgi:SAM-dependent methyltransferase
LEALTQAIQAEGRRGAIELLGRGPESGRIDALVRVVDSRRRGGYFVDEWGEYSGEGRADYFVVRWACPSFLSALALLPLLAGRRVLDLGGGAGHLAGILSAVHPRAEVVVCDCDLVGLLAARAYVAPGVVCGCVDLDQPLPLADASFDVVVMSDSFHYLEAPDKLLREAFRVLRPDGQLLLVHVHDPRDLTGERVPGTPVLPAKLCERIRQACPAAEVRAFSEGRLLADAARGVPLSSILADSPSDPPAGPFTVWAGSGSAAPPVRRVRFPARPAACGLIPNPVYTVHAGRHTWRLRLHWPSEETRREWSPRNPLPVAVTIPQDASPTELAGLCWRGVLVPDRGGRVSPPLSAYAVRSSRCNHFSG